MGVVSLSLPDMHSTLTDIVTSLPPRPRLQQGFGSYESYAGCRGVHPASSRLHSVPPRFYDLVDGDSGEVLDSDWMHRNRARSMIRSTRAKEDAAWSHPLYGDMVTGSRASPGHLGPRTSTEFSRDFISRSRSPSPAPETINNMNIDMIDTINEKLHLLNMKARFPETFRGQSSSYNPTLGRYQTSYDSPGFRYYRYDNQNEPRRISHYNVGHHAPRYSTRMSERIWVPRISPDTSYLTRRVMRGAK